MHWMFVAICFWNTLSYKQQMQRYAKAVKEQQELNEQLASEGLINEVNDDWEETEKSPALSGQQGFSYNINKSAVEN